MFKVNNKATKMTPWRRFGGFIVNFEHTSHLCSNVSIVNFKQVNAGWEGLTFPQTTTKNSALADQIESGGLLF